MAISALLRKLAGAIDPEAFDDNTYSSAQAENLMIDRDHLIESMGEAAAAGRQANRALTEAADAMKKATPTGRLDLLADLISGIKSGGSA